MLWMKRVGGRGKWGKWGKQGKNEINVMDLRQGGETEGSIERMKWWRAMGGEGKHTGTIIGNNSFTRHKTVWSGMCDGGVRETQAM